MKTVKILTILLLALVQMASAAQTLIVNGEAVDEVALKTGRICIVQIVSDSSNPYSAYVGFDNRVVLGSLSHEQTMPEAGDLGAAVEYSVPTFYGYFVTAAGSSPLPSAGVHFVFTYNPSTVGITTLKLYDSTLTVLLDSAEIMVLESDIGTGITYQGRMMDNNDVADGLYDLRFELYDSPSDGNLIGSVVEVNDLDMVDGYFTAELDFEYPEAFNEEGRWLEIGVRAWDSSDPNGYTVLSPRQRIAATPHALGLRGVYVDNDENVGMGTTSPAGRLHVDGGKAADDTNASNITIKAQDGGDAVLGQIGHRGGNIILLPGVGGESPGFAQPGPPGKVGIGTAYPEAILDVRGNVEVDQKILAHDTGGLHLATDEGTTRILVADDGKVGIGTNTPRASLEVTNDGSSHAIRASTSDIPVYAHRTSTSGTWPAVAGDCNSQANDASGVRGRILSTNPGSLGAGVYGYNYGTGSNGVGVRGHHAGSGYAGYFTGGKNYFQGDVGIGTTNPSQKLDVRGNAAISGNVGIGTTNPSEKLEVKGNIDVSSNNIKRYYGFPRPNYDSGWVPIDQGEDVTLTHGLGGDVDNYVVDMQFKNTASMSFLGIHCLGYGYYNSATGSVGGFYYGLGTNTIEVQRALDDSVVSDIRIRIWVYE